MDLSRLDDLPSILANDSSTPEFEEACQLLAYFLFCVLRRAEYSPHDAEALSLEALSEIVLKISRFRSRGEGSFAAWCARLTLNRAKNWIRSQQQSGGTTFDPDWLDSNHQAFVDVSLDGLISEEAALAWKLFESLDEKAYQLVLMRAIDERSFEEIGVALGISEANARQMYRRTRLKLAKLIVANKAV